MLGVYLLCRVRASTAWGRRRALMVVDRSTPCLRRAACV